jgi:hypothetical protein
MRYPRFLAVLLFVLTLPSFAAGPLTKWFRIDDSAAPDAPVGSVISNGLKIDSSGNIYVSMAGGTPAITNSFGFPLDSSGNLLVDCAAGCSSTVYPGAGIANSTGSAWGTSYTTSGSGTVVALATSPVFVTPALGTPASGVATNLTGLPLNGVVSPTSAPATVADGNYPITFSSAQTSNTQSAIAFTEATAATGGSGNNELAVSTAANSTSTVLNLTQGAISSVFPTALLNLSQGANTGATNVPIFNSATTFNNSSLVGNPLVQNVTCTAAAAASNLFNFQLGGVSAISFGYPTANCGGSPTLTLAASGILVAPSQVKTSTFSGNGAANNVVVTGGLVGSSNNATEGSLTAQGSDNSNTGGSAAGGSLTLRGGNLTGAATNLPGADVIVAGGLGTGNSTSAHVKLEVPTFSATTGTTAQTLTTSYVVHKKLGSTSSATPTTMFNIPVAVNQTIGVMVIVHVETTQATPHNCSTTESFTASVQNTGGTVTSQATAGTIGTICDTGTLTLAVAFSAATPSVFSVTPSWVTIAPSAVIITVEIHNLSQQDIALL